MGENKGNNARHRKENKTTVLTCETCGQEYAAHSTKSKYCSSKCKSSAYMGKKHSPLSETTDLNDCQYEHCCKTCNKIYFTDYKHFNQKYCSDECRRKPYLEYQRNYNLSREVLSTRTDLTVKDYVECPICKNKYASLSIAHFRRHGYTALDDFKNDHPYVKLKSDALATLTKGDANPCSKRNMPEMKRKEISPYCVEHYIKKYDVDYDTAEAMMRDFIQKQDRSNWNISTRMEYFLSKGYSYDESVELLRQRQTTNGIGYYTQKYGVDGARKYAERMAAWANKVLKGNNHSAIEMTFISDILEHLTSDMSNYRYGDNAVTCKNPNTSRNYCIDFADIVNKKAIEFFGDYWHCNPRKYNGDFFNKSSKKYAHEIWAHDKKKIEDLKSLGYSVLIIFESDYRERRMETIYTVLGFLCVNA